MRALLCLLLLSTACLEEPTWDERDLVVSAASSEGFESGSKGSYATGDVELGENA